jgi:Family of unknown function (DUF6169)
MKCILRMLPVTFQTILAYLVQSRFFGFYSQTKIKAFDPLVSNTIVKLVSDYFEQNPLAILLFLYDQSGGKQGSRFRLFKRWFEAYSLLIYSKMDLSIDGIIYASAFFMENHPKRDEINSLLKALTDNIESK